VRRADAENTILSSFEDSFLQRSIHELVENCERYSLTPYFRSIIPNHQPMLEAGCGAGQWVAWAVENGWVAIGIDWSASLIERARAEIPRGEFLVGDLRAIPLESGSVGSIISLGAIEHSVEGPEEALREFGRVLRSGGIAVVTVPYLSALRRLVRKPSQRLQTSRTLRKIRRKSTGLTKAGLDEALAHVEPGRTVNVHATPNGWKFFEYEFDERTMRNAVAQAGLEILEEFPFGFEEGLVQNLRGLAGRYDAGGSGPQLNYLGRMLARGLREGTCEHMIAYVLRNP
jgi:SAM-dependent methyltransferase